MIDFTKEEFLEAIKSSKSYQEAYIKLGYSGIHGTSVSLKTKYKTRFVKLVHELKPDVSHFNLKSRSCLDKNQNSESLIIELLFNELKGKRRKVAIDIKEFEKIIKSNCYYCNCSPSFRSKKTCRRINLIKINGIDRIDSSKDYIKGNCRACCKNCNRMKSALKEKDFYIIIKKIYENLHLEKTGI